MTDVYRNAFTEVDVIINYLNECDYNKIPKDIIDIIEENKNEDYEYYLDESIPFTEQKMMPETKAILFNFFRNYFSTKEQKEKILNYQNAERIKIEQSKIKEYKNTNDIFYVKDNKLKKENDKTIIKEKSLIKVEKINIFSKMVRFIKNIIKKNKK